MISEALTGVFLDLMLFPCDTLLDRPPEALYDSPGQEDEHPSVAEWHALTTSEARYRVRVLWDDFTRVLLDGYREPRASGHMALNRISERLSASRARMLEDVDPNTGQILTSALPEHLRSEDARAEAVEKALVEWETRYFVVSSRAAVVSTVLRLYEVFGTWGMWDDLGRAFAGHLHPHRWQYLHEMGGEGVVVEEPPATPYNERTVEYLRAVQQLRGREYDPKRGAAEFFRDVAALSPKSDGEIPDGRAVRIQFQRDEFIKKGQRLGDFRQRLEAEADRLPPAVMPGISEPPDEQFRMRKVELFKGRNGHRSFVNRNTE